MTAPAAFPRMRSGESGLVTNATLVFIIAGIITLMILPLPSAVLDGLIALNITAALVLLLTSLYIASPVELSAFPSLLLITTVYRLSLSIAATRLILTEGQAGRVIDTFGTLAAGGNLVVGLVAFLIVTVVQFVVIAKGAERVAEVSARFSLDSMPGKQLSIDSDLRSGLIDKEEARRRRRVLDLESRLHGGLDGAMKFVKGDAIASLIIVAVNLVGGLLIGVLQRGLSPGEAIHTYSVLTIGDGLVTQIPALLITMAAGLIVTRTNEEDSGESLAALVRRQFSARPQAIIIGGLLCWGLAFVPGFPWEIFLVLGSVCLVLGIALDEGLKSKVARHLGPAGRFGRALTASQDAAPIAAPLARPVCALELEHAEGLVSPLSANDLRLALSELLDRVQTATGLALPAIGARRSEGLEAGGWRLLAYGLPIAAGTLGADEPRAQLLAELSFALRRNIGTFVGMQETSNLLVRTAIHHPEVVKEVQKTRPLPKLAEVVRRLAVEGVPLANLHLALEAIAAADTNEKDTGVLTEYARMALRDHIAHQHAPDGILRAFTLSPRTEALLREALTERGGGRLLALPPPTAKRLIEAIRARTGQTRVIAVPFELRRHLRRLIEPDLFEVSVTAFNEIPPRMKFEVAGFIEAASAEAEVA